MEEYQGALQKSKFASVNASAESDKTANNATERYDKQSAVTDYLVSVIDHEALNLDVKL